ncbi:MFS transporter [Acetobacter sp. AC2005]|uniref:MFS transporter n=1 Tax=Acetobacter sp. AC2005 TaxID=3134142 RepID=UPI0030CAA264
MRLIRKFQPERNSLMVQSLQQAGKTPRDFGMQYLGLLFFMIGDGVEVGYLSPFLVSSGISEHQVAFIFTLYGFAAAISAWGAGLLCEYVGCRKVIIAGVVLWVVPQVLFLAWALPSHTTWGILLTYSIRGFGYPLLAYGILTLIVKEVSAAQRGLASGIFWFCFTCGLPTLGTIVAAASLPILGEYLTFWVALGVVILGGSLSVIALPNNSDQPKALSIHQDRHFLQFLKDGYAYPSLLLVCIIRAINSAATHGIIVFMPFYFVQTLGLSNELWIHFLETIFASNIIFNVLLGAVSDRLSWRGTVLWAGGIGSSFACALLYWVPALYGHSHPWSVYVAAILFGLTLAGYVPLSALTPSLLPEKKGVAMSFLNLGAGCSVWLGPLIVYIFQPFVGVAGVIHIYAFLFFVSGILVSLIKIPQSEGRILHSQNSSSIFSPMQL